MKRLLSIIATAAVLTACGGGGSGANAPADPEGIYTGKFGQYNVTMVIDSKGNAAFLEPDLLKDANFTVVDGQASFVSAYCNRSSPTGVSGASQALQFDGETATALTGTITDSSNSGDAGSFSLTPQPAVYAEGASLATLAGTYSTTANNCSLGTGGGHFTLTFD